MAGGRGFACDASLLSGHFFVPAGLVIVISSDPSLFFYSIISVEYFNLRIQIHLVN